MKKELLNSGIQSGVCTKILFIWIKINNREEIEVDKNNLEKVESILKKNSVHFDLLGEITEKEIIINDEPTFTVDKVTEFYKGWLYKYMS